MMRILLEGPRTDKQLLMSPAVAEGSLGYGTPFEGMAHDQFLQLAAEVNAILDPVEVPPIDRSEEHTSELQSLMRTSFAALCLKKKITNILYRRENTKRKTVCTINKTRL